GADAAPTGASSRDGGRTAAGCHERHDRQRTSRNLWPSAGAHNGGTGGGRGCSWVRDFTKVGRRAAGAAGRMAYRHRRAASKIIKVVFNGLSASLRADHGPGGDRQVVALRLTEPRP